MYRTIIIHFLYLLVLSLAGCSGLTGNKGQSSKDKNCRFLVNPANGWDPVETVPLGYKDLPGIEEGEKFLEILSNPDGSGIIMFVTRNIPVPMYEFQKDIYDLMEQREKEFKTYKTIKKYRCINSYKNYGEIFGIDSYYEYWVFQGPQKKLKGIRQAYFVSRDNNSICSVSKILYSNPEGYDENLVAFSDITILE